MADLKRPFQRQQYTSRIKLKGVPYPPRPPVSWIVPHLCGVPKAKREKRWLVMIRCFVDDSGNHDADPYFILAGWAAKVETWDIFAGEWELELAKPKPIDYYKQSEANGLSGCFEKFMRPEATQKTVDMATFTGGYHVYGFVLKVPRPQFKSSVVGQTIKARRAKINRWVANLFPAAFGTFVPFVLQKHYYKLGIREKVDFIFDS